MIRKPITIGISNGLEARPIAMLVQVASQYVSNIYPVSYTHLDVYKRQTAYVFYRISSRLNITQLASDCKAGYNV